MKKILLLCVPVIFLVGCSTSEKSSEVSKTTISSTEEKIEYVSKKLSLEDVNKISVDNDIETVYEKLGKPLKEWENEFVYEEMDESIKRNELVITLLGDSKKEMSEQYSELVDYGNKAKDINKLKMLQYTYSDEDTENTALFWISPRTEKVVYLNQRSFIDENGEGTNDSSNTENSAPTVQTYDIGTSVAFSSQSGQAIEVTITSISKNPGDDWHTPSGKFFAKVDFTIKNIGSEPFDASSHLFEFYDSNDTKATLDSWDFFSESIQANKSAQGTAYFDVLNDGNSCEVYFSDTSWKGTY